MGPKTWDDSKAFQPEPFLDSEATNIVNAKKLLAFTTGKQNCLSESVAEVGVSDGRSKKGRIATIQISCVRNTLEARNDTGAFPTVKRGVY